MRLAYVGPAGQINHEVGAETGAPELEPDSVIVVSAELGRRLLASSTWFKRAKADASPDEKTTNEA